VIKKKAIPAKIKNKTILNTKATALKASLRIVSAIKPAIIRPRTDIQKPPLNSLYVYMH
jgi:hypothetical protein